jgi:hypothetical protein
MVAIPTHLPMKAFRATDVSKLVQRAPAAETAISR